MKKVCVVGLKQNGLVTGILAAQAGLNVVGVTHDERLAEDINTVSYQDAIPEITETLNAMVTARNFKAVTAPESADYFLITEVMKRTEKRVDFSVLTDAAHALVPVLKKGDTVIITKTVPVGTTRSFIEVLAHETGFVAHEDFYVAYCPEREVPGHYFQEIKVHDRVIGAVDQVSVQKAAEFYKYCVSGDLYLTDLATAELTKLVEDSYQDVMGAFSHQVASVARRYNINPHEVMELANKHPYVSLASPSCGLGKHCMVTHSEFINDDYKDDADLVYAARKINDSIPHSIQTRIEQTVAQWKIEKDKEKCTVLLLGISSSADCGDIEHSPARSIAENLVKDRSVKVMIADPHVTHDHQLQDHLVSIYEGIKAADLVVSLVAHDEFQDIKTTLTEQHTVLDFCGVLYSSHEVARQQEQFFWPASSTGITKVSTTTDILVASDDSLTQGETQ